MTGKWLGYSAFFVNAFATAGNLWVWWIYGGLYHLFLSLGGAGFYGFVAYRIHRMENERAKDESGG